MSGLALEVGAVYRSKTTGNLYLAVRKILWVTYIERALKEVKARKGFSIERALPVRELLSEWEISIQELDRISALYLDPPAHRNVGTRQRRTTRRGGNTEELEIFKEIRLHQIFTPHHKST